MNTHADSSCMCLRIPKRFETKGETTKGGRGPRSAAEICGAHCLQILIVGWSLSANQVPLCFCATLVKLQCVPCPQFSPFLHLFLSILEWSLFFNLRSFSISPPEMIPIHRKIMYVKDRLDWVTVKCAPRALNFCKWNLIDKHGSAEIACPLATVSSYLTVFVFIRFGV